jgi:hypothetical protein
MTDLHAPLTIEDAHRVRRNPGMFPAEVENAAHALIRAEIRESCRVDGRVMLAKKLASEFRQIETIDAMLIRSRQAQDAKARAEAAERRKDRHARVIAAVCIAAIAALLLGIDPANAIQF